MFSGFSLLQTRPWFSDNITRTGKRYRFRSSNTNETSSSQHCSKDAFQIENCSQLPPCNPCNNDSNTRKVCILVNLSSIQQLKLP